MRWLGAAILLNDFADSPLLGHCAGHNSVTSAKSFNVAAKRLYLALAEAWRPGGPLRGPDRPALARLPGASLSRGPVSNSPQPFSSSFILKSIQRCFNLRFGWRSCCVSKNCDAQISQVENNVRRRSLTNLALVNVDSQAGIAFNKVDDVIVFLGDTYDGFLLVFRCELADLIHIDGQKLRDLVHVNAITNLCIFQE